MECWFEKCYVVFCQFAEYSSKIKLFENKGLFGPYQTWLHQNIVKLISKLLLDQSLCFLSLYQTFLASREHIQWNRSHLFQLFLFIKTFKFSLNLISVKRIMTCNEENETQICMLGQRLVKKIHNLRDLLVISLHNKQTQNWGSCEIEFQNLWWKLSSWNETRFSVRKRVWTRIWRVNIIFKFRKKLVLLSRILLHSQMKISIGKCH